MIMFRLFEEHQQVSALDLPPVPRSVLQYSHIPGAREHVLSGAALRVPPADGSGRYRTVGQVALEGGVHQRVETIAAHHRNLLR